MKRINLSINGKQFINLDRYVDEEIASAENNEGLCIVTVEDPSVALLLAEDNKDVLDDISEELERLLPPRTNYLNNAVPEKAAAFSMAALLSQSKELIYTDKQRLAKNKSLYVYALTEENVCIDIKCI